MTSVLFGEEGGYIAFLIDTIFHIWLFVLLKWLTIHEDMAEKDVGEQIKMQEKHVGTKFQDI
jgi:hypothetical protein